jgi:(E)-4-hydroxy-3-methylbut-2-enyl-diphosphate synthase
MIKVKRKKTKTIYIGGVPVGGRSPISVQSMTKTDTRDIKATISQIKELKDAGCEIVRLAVPDMEAAKAIGKIKKAVGASDGPPLVADIHFDWRLALESIRQGADALRINPGNIGARWKVKEVVAALKEKGIPLRVGVNAGSLEKDLLNKYGHPCAEALVESAERHMSMLDEMGFNAVKVSLKASNVPTTVEAYRFFSKRHNCPLHLGVSEAGPPSSGIIKSSVGLGILLSGGIGDTIRVSLTAGPVEEVKAAYGILNALGLRKRGPEIISCPTCGRCRIDLRGLALKVERLLGHIESPITVAVMGCAVNGPGEAREADYGVAGGRGMGLVFRKGQIVKKVKESMLLKELMKVIREDSWR